jgi:hypothetical protein
MPVAKVHSQWVSGALQFFDVATGTVLLSIDPTNLKTTLLNSTGVVKNLLVTVTLAQIQAGIVILPAAPGVTITPLSFRLIVNGTAGGSGNFVIQDTNGSPVAIVTVAEAQLTGQIVPATVSITLGAGYLAPLTAGKGIAIPASASLTTLTSITVSLDYVLS